MANGIRVIKEELGGGRIPAIQRLARVQYPPERRPLADKMIAFDTLLESQYSVKADGVLRGFCSIATINYTVGLYDPLGDKYRVVDALMEFFSDKKKTLLDYNDSHHALYQPLVDSVRIVYLEMIAELNQRPQISNPEIEVSARALKESDLTEAEKVYKELFGLEPGNWIRTSLQTDPEFSLVAEHQGSMIGFIFAMTGDGGYARIHSEGVSEKYRGMGVGEFLLRSQLNRLHERGFTRIISEVEEDDNASIELNKKAGFRVLKKIPKFNLKD
jgi:ribosomal protein S18 acetylase RimI-like enzyme